MEGFPKGESVPASESDRRGAVMWSSDVAQEVLRRVAAGETLDAICADPSMPGRRTVSGWMKKRAVFRASMEAVRQASGRSFVGRPSGYCQATAERIFERLCAGEAMVVICRDPEMPAASTVYRWLKEQPVFRRAVGLAREIQADMLGARGWEMALAAERADAWLTDVRLKHLRWYAGKLSPRVYGPSKAVEPWAAAGEAGPPPPPPPPPAPEPPSVTRKSFWIETSDDGKIRVRSSWYSPQSGRIEQEVPGEWEIPVGQVAWHAEAAHRRQLELEAKQALRQSQGPPDPDAAQWL